MVKRCDWSTSEEIYIQYHDEEWGVPQHNDQRLFEKLMLEGAQAGLSWITILKRRENYREAFDNFDATKIAAYDEEKIQSLLQNEGIIRNKLKIRSVVSNAKAFLAIVEEFGTFDQYIWGFVNHKPIVNKRKQISDIVAITPESEAMSKDLKKRGFKFIGPTICYAYMQSMGMVNDHLVDCFRYHQVGN